MTEPVTSTVVAVPAATVAAATGLHLSIFWAAVTGIGLLGAGAGLGYGLKKRPKLSDDEVMRLRKADAALEELRAALATQGKELGEKIEYEQAAMRDMLVKVVEVSAQNVVQAQAEALAPLKSDIKDTKALADAMRAQQSDIATFVLSLGDKVTRLRSALTERRAPAPVPVPAPSADPVIVSEVITSPSPSAE